jgi:hypothetical protein
LTEEGELHVKATTQLMKVEQAVGEGLFPESQPGVVAQHVLSRYAKELREQYAMEKKPMANLIEQVLVGA